ncbi:MAG TPA: AAA family ATPase [Verrucomicrobiae bacterium]|nr:AAA family ATPase [Verrucomicrobiae bacterium]
MAFIKAVRQTVPMLISLSGTSGSGKTMSGLLLAAGLAGTNGRIGMIDAENKRGSLYADDPLVTSALPQGYEIEEISAPYTPKKYIDRITEAEKSGISVCIIDSTSHEWEGEGGCCDIAENNKLRGMPNWAMAKREHKKFLAYCLSSNMHIIFCLRAREKIKIVKVNNKEEIVPIGIQPIAEKNFVFEMLLSLQFDEATHYARGIKVPKMLVDVFPGDRMITKADGERMRIWNETGATAEPNEQLKKRARSSAEQGMATYTAFFAELSTQQKKVIRDSVHDELKAIAASADKSDAPQEVSELPDPFEFSPGHRLVCKGVLYEANSDLTSWTKVEHAA